YRKHIEKDAALARRFQTVFVAEPSVEDTISILRGLKEKYEVHHGVRITDGAIVAAATLSNRYITDRFLPDKAIDLVDEAASRLRMEVDSKPEEIDELDRRIIQLKIEREALKRETDEASRDRLKKLEGELVDLEEKSGALTAQWQAEKEKMAGAQKLKEKLEEAKNELVNAQRQGNLGRAGELAYGVIPELERSLKAAEVAEQNHMLKEEVTDEDIAGVVSRWTGIPVDKMLEGEREKLLHMEAALGRRVVGQADAVKVISEAVRRARAGLQDPNRPLGSFLFLGPTGVGKTELTKAVASFLFDDETALLRIDMSEYMEKHAVARLIGAPPGYVGYDEGGALTEAVRRRPYQVILFDEVEKAHPDVFNILLQVLDDGRLTDGHGRTVDFRNTLIVLTSNLGSEVLANQPDGQDTEAVRGQVMDVVRAAFRPEFLNRLDEIILFHRLTRDQMGAIVDIQLQRLKAMLADRKIALELTDAARAWLGREGYDPVYGARPLKRVIQRSLQNPLAELILAGKVADGATVRVNVGEGGLAIEGARAAAA
ncbi:MAG: AAA family ATPase, partial [Rhodospirillales bacterium]